MIIFPAIDIKNGKVVRLIQGKFDSVTEYGNDPLAMAQHWENKGATWIHVVDLDGAKEGAMKNTAVILKMAHNVKAALQVGGGIRTKEDIAKLIDGGVSRVILGTKIVEEKTFLKESLSLWKDKIAVSLDCSNGRVLQKGWTSQTNIKAVDFIPELERLGLKCLIYTDIAKDGMLCGPNFEALEEILNITKIPVIASGGISSLEDIKKLHLLEKKGLVGAITGKAIYEGKLDLKEALKIIKIC
ncbi:MAG TPA: 1-(5-phosphoribosyl)-5-[(5-phosphoribosylamino)methylideneamino]imidazole-4-carboxamide isomerase [Candidatus Omnitrophota bacterium]|nr:1-(5-phosphoribosyl)-5-[(5-phosphoribosylamino)methylideneamino]imidazole-4-carboxamide isomerase [Candidatus Omnitrophota bacterium]